MIIIQQQTSRQIEVKSAKKASSKFNKSIIAQKQSRKTSSIKKMARKASIERKKVVKKYKTKRVDEATNFDDELKFFSETCVLLINRTVKALREIRRMQKSTNLIISRLSFEKIARDILIDIDTTFRFKKSFLKTLQEAAKAMLITKFESKIL
jgi:hypothetical protein